MLDGYRKTRLVSHVFLLGSENSSKSFDDQTLIHIPCIGLFQSVGMETCGDKPMDQGIKRGGVKNGSDESND